MRAVWRHARDRGVALVVVLWVVMLLALIAQSFANGARTDTRLVLNLIENAQARALADGELHRAIARIVVRRGDMDAVFDGRWETFETSNASVAVSVEDEAGKIDLNVAQLPLLSDLLQAAGLGGTEAARIAAAIVDWRDPDNLVQLNGAEDSDYRAAGLAYGAKDAPFETVQELQQVLGVDAALSQRIAPNVTVYSPRGRTDLSAAPELVVRAVLAGNEAAIANVLEARANRDPGGLSASSANVAALRQSARSPRRVFTIRVRVETNNRARAGLDAVVRIDRIGSRPFSILEWRPAQSDPAALVADGNS